MVQPVSLIFVLVVFASIASTKIEVGPEVIHIFGGKKGSVTFPHRRHQKNLGDCKICNSIFAKKLGSIKKLKENGDIKKKQVMKKL